MCDCTEVMRFLKISIPILSRNYDCLEWSSLRVWLKTSKFWAGGQELKLIFKRTIARESILSRRYGFPESILLLFFNDSINHKEFWASVRLSISGSLEEFSWKPTEWQPQTVLSRTLKIWQAFCTRGWIVALAFLAMQALACCCLTHLSLATTTLAVINYAVEFHL